MLLPQDFYARETLDVAQDLLGKLLVRDEVVLRITEVEAYRRDDTANHCRAGRTARNAAMWGPPGQAYVYLCYGLHQLLNLVTEPEGTGTAVLVRACEIVEGLETVQARRGRVRGPAMLTGPGKVGAALALDTSWCHHPVHVTGGLSCHDAPAVADVLSGPRVGVDYAQPEHRDAPWRLAVAGTRWVSHPKGLT